MLDTLENVKARLGVTGSANDQFLTQQIQLVSDVIEAYCRRKFLLADYRQTFYPREYKMSGKFLELYHYPVPEVSSVKQDGVEIDSSLYRIHAPTGILSGDRFWYYGCQKIEVEYSAGYETCPTPILAVLDDIVGSRYNKKMSGVDLNFGTDVQRVSIPGAISIDFDYSLKNNEENSFYGTILGNNANLLTDWRSERAILGSGKLEYVEEI